MISSVYSPVAEYVSTTSTSTSAGERNGRAIRRKFRKPVSTVEPWNVDECKIMLRGSDGSIREVAGFVVRRGDEVRRFVNRECAERFISQN